MLEKRVSVKVGLKSVDYSRNSKGTITLEGYLSEDAGQDLFLLVLDEDTMTGERIKWPAVYDRPDVQPYPEIVPGGK